MKMSPTGSTSHVSNLVAGNPELAGRPLMQAAFNGFFKDLFAMSINELTAKGIILRETAGASEHFRLL